MKIVTYSSTEPAPSRAWFAHFLVDGHPLPVVFYAASEEAVRRAAQTFWDKESAKRHRASPPKKAAARLVTNDDLDGLLG